MEMPQQVSSVPSIHIGSSQLPITADPKHLTPIFDFTGTRKNLCTYPHMHRVQKINL